MHQEETQLELFSSSSKINYEISDELKTAKFKVVLVAINQSPYALKLFPYQGDQPSRSFKDESRFLSLQHPNVVKYVDSAEELDLPTEYDNIQTSGILMKFAPYGDFFDLLITNQMMLSETLVRTYFHHLIEGLEYLHQNGIAHLDLKLDNLLIGEDYKLQIADFDLSYKEGDTRIKSKGTRFYRSNEIKEGQCKDPFKADIYSAAIILFMLKTRGMPAQMENQLHEGINLQELMENSPEEFWQAHSKLLKKPLEFFSREFRDLFHMMTKSNPDERATLNEIKNSAWYNGHAFSQKELSVMMKQKLSTVSFKKLL